MAAFEVLPAVDVSAGRLARMVRGDRATLAARSGDPVELARTFLDQGARWIHVVDLDAALTGIPANLELMEAICQLPVAVQAGGGLSAEAVDQVLGRGARRAVLGAASLSDAGTVTEVVRRHGAAVAVGLDVRGGMVSPRGKGRTGPTLADAVGLLRTAGPRLVVYTDVERDGTEAGPDLDGLRAVAGGVASPVLASGGVRSLDDLRALAALFPSVAGAIVGRALHEGSFTLGEALAAVG